MKNNPCRLVMLLLAIACAMAASCVRAEIYPARPVQLVVPYPAGGVTDVLARALAQGLTRRWEQTVY
ncbi:MAG: tripartite tricarboxylate transporter substrate binding protein, partial [Burkholderiales bacterium]